MVPSMYGACVLACLLAVHRTYVIAEHVVRPRQECDLNQDCSQVRNAGCQDGYCACNGDRHYYILDPAGCFTSDERKNTVRQQRVGQLKLHLACTSDYDCEHIDYSACVSGECRCVEPRQYFLQPLAGCYTPKERKRVIKHHMEHVQEQKAKQYKGLTIVDSDHLYLSSQPPDTPCTGDADCAREFEYAVCAPDRLCKCADGDRFHGFGDHIGCYGVNQPAVVLNRRKRSTRYAPLQQVGGGCGVDSDCALANSGCHPEHGVCACYTGFYANDNGGCDEIVLDSPCPADGSDDYFCQRSILRAACLYGHCACPRDYHILGEDVDGSPACLDDDLSRQVSEARWRLSGLSTRPGQGRDPAQASRKEGFGPRRRK